MAPQLPPVVWAERPEVVLVTVAVQDSSDVKVATLPTSVHVQCKADGKDYEVKLELKGEIVPEESSYVARPRQIEFKLQKKESGPYWEGLTKGKMLNVKIDWGRWVDEDEANGAKDLGDFGMGGMMGGMGGMGGGNMLEQMGGLEGMGGVNLGGGGDPEKIQEMLAAMGRGEGDAAPGVQEVDDDDDDDDMPGLEKQ